MPAEQPYAWRHLRPRHGNKSRAMAATDSTRAVMGSIFLLPMATVVTGEYRTTANTIGAIFPAWKLWRGWRACFAEPLSGLI
jgi:hypothetical protein